MQCQAVVDETPGRGAQSFGVGIEEFGGPGAGQAPVVQAAQGIAHCTHVAFHHDRDHPFFLSGTGPFTKMGLDNPDTLYFGTRVQAGSEYVVSGVRGTTNTSRAAW